MSSNFYLLYFICADKKILDETLGKLNSLFIFFPFFLFFHFSLVLGLTEIEIRSTPTLSRNCKRQQQKKEHITKFGEFLVIWAIFLGIFYSTCVPNNHAILHRHVLCNTIIIMLSLVPFIFSNMIYFFSSASIFYF